MSNRARVSLDSRTSRPIRERDSSRNHNALKECLGAAKNQTKCPESSLLIRRINEPKQKGTRSRYLRKGVFMNEFLFLAVIMIYLAIRY
jgi:hypothetical protein